VDECKPLHSGHLRPGERGGGLRQGVAEEARGEAVQVDPIKPKLKASGTKRLTLQSDEPLSNVAFKIDLRRYTEDLASTDICEHALEALRASKVKRVIMVGRRGVAQAAFSPKVGRCRLTLSNSRRKRLELSC